MAMIKCSECGNSVSDKAASCPKCGAPISVHAGVVHVKMARPGARWEGVGFLLIVVGMLATMMDATTLGPLAIFSGFVVFVIGRFK